MEFLCIGFDVRVFPCQSSLSADYSEWERNEKTFSLIKCAFNIHENAYSLLEITTQKKVADVVNYINNKAIHCDLAAIEIQNDIAVSRNMKFGLNNPLNQLDLSSFVCSGLDVCDINGFYTCFNHPEILKFFLKKGKNVGLIPETDIEFALEVAQYANYIDQNHRPFVVMKVSSLKHKGQAE